MSITSRVLFLSLLAGCHGELVPIEDDDGTAPVIDAMSASPTWSGDIARRLQRCTSCHGSAGRYSLATYRDSFGPGTDAVPNVVAGDTHSALVDYCRRGHGELAASDSAIIERWVVDGAREE